MIVLHAKDAPHSRHGSTAYSGTGARQRSLQTSSVLHKPDLFCPLIPLDCGAPLTRRPAQAPASPALKLCQCMLPVHRIPLPPSFHAWMWRSGGLGACPRCCCAALLSMLPVCRGPLPRCLPGRQLRVCSTHIPSTPPAEVLPALPSLMPICAPWAYPRAACTALPVAGPGAHHALCKEHHSMLSITQCCSKSEQAAA